MKKFLLFALVSLVSFTYAKNVETSLQESLELKRITEYWKEKDYATVKVKIRDFLSKNPQSTYLDQLYAMLGDLYFQEKNFSEAAIAYQKIQESPFSHSTRFHFLHALYETQRFEEFIQRADLFLMDPNARSEELDTIRFELGEIYFLKAHLPENVDQKKELCQAALVQYQQLMESKYMNMTLLPQAEIYTLFDEHAKAASLYLLLAYKEEEKKEEYLFQAACLQLHCDKKAAIETFSRIVSLEGKYGSKAAFNQLNLLFQEKRYRDFILTYDKVSQWIPQDKTFLITYFLGKSLFLTEDYTHAVAPLQESLASKMLDRSQEKSALLAIAACGKEMKNIPLIETTLSHLKSKFSNDEETASILLLHAQLCREKQQWNKAHADIAELLQIYPLHPERESLLYDDALLFIQEKKWEEGATAFRIFLETFPQTPHRVSALRQIVSCRMEDVKRASTTTERIKKEELLAALLNALEEQGTFSLEENKAIRYLLGKTYHGLGKEKEAIAILSKYVEDFAGESNSFDAYLLLADAHQKQSQDDLRFAFYLEEALACQPTSPQALDLHLSLYNTYLKLASKASTEEKKDKISQAADHLFCALKKLTDRNNLKQGVSYLSISKENQRWLADYYFQQYSQGSKTALEKTAIVLENLLGIQEEYKGFAVAPVSLDREAEAVKLADVYAKMGRLIDRIELLETLSQLQQEHPELAWKCHRMVQFDLGKGYLALGKREKALQQFEELARTASRTPSYFATAAQVEIAKLQFALLHEEDREQDVAAVSSICDLLKEIQIKRRLHSEPLHLEAALCYIDIKSALMPPEERNSYTRFLLEQMKESFASPENLESESYFSAAAQFPDKEVLRRQYLNFVDLKVLSLEAEELKSETLLKEAENELEQLMAESRDPSLHERIQQSLEKLGAKVL